MEYQRNSTLWASCSLWTAEGDTGKTCNLPTKRSFCSVVTYHLDGIQPGSLLFHSNGVYSPRQPRSAPEDAQELVGLCKPHSRHPSINQATQRRVLRICSPGGPLFCLSQGAPSSPLLIRLGPEGQFRVNPSWARLQSSPSGQPLLPAFETSRRFSGRIVPDQTATIASLARTQWSPGWQICFPSGIREVIRDSTLLGAARPLLDREERSEGVLLLPTTTIRMVQSSNPFCCCAHGRARP